MRVMRRARWAVVVGAMLPAVLAACAAGPTPPAHHPATALGQQPNIVYVLTDDLSGNLVQYMPHVLALEKAGTSFPNYTVSDSFCCPSRSSILTGDFPHDTGIFTNSGPDGGFPLFHRRGEEDHTFATALQDVGYRTGFMGKYLNGYVPDAQVGADGMPEPHTPDGSNWVPPGWNTWDVSGAAYDEYNYLLNENHHVQHFGNHPQDYATDVLAEHANRFIRTAAGGDSPFLLEVATFAPHLPATPAKQDRDRFSDVHAPRNRTWDRNPTHAPKWLAGAHFGPSQWPYLNKIFRKRVRAVQAVDRMIGTLEQTLRATGQLKNTVFVFNSDNGFHIGEYGLYPGKLTAFDTDVVVPLIVAGPHIPAGRIDPAVVQNVDLAPTFEQIGGAPVAADVDGRSIVALLAGRHVPWRTDALIEHHGGDFGHDNPDQQAPDAGNPPSYEAIRNPDYTYVAYADGEHEYYNRRTDPWELNNAFDTLSASRIAELNARLRGLQDCHGAAACWAAGQPSPDE